MNLIVFADGPQATRANTHRERSPQTGGTTLYFVTMESYQLRGAVTEEQCLAGPGHVVDGTGVDVECPYGVTVHLVQNAAIANGSADQHATAGRHCSAAQMALYAKCGESGRAQLFWHIGP
ncbi:MAG: hypothetical protein AAGF12_00090 [Myxococcota bacterium]